MVERLNTLLDERGTDERDPLYSLLDTLGIVLHAWEEQHHDMPECGGADVLQFFMEEHHLSQSDLPKVDSQGVVSEILSGKRELNVRQVRALSKRFGVLTLGICVGSINGKGQENGSSPGEA